MRYVNINGKPTPVTGASAQQRSFAAIIQARQQAMAEYARNQARARALQARSTGGPLYQVQPSNIPRPYGVLQPGSYQVGGRAENGGRALTRPPAPRLPAPPPPRQPGAPSPFPNIFARGRSAPPAPIRYEMPPAQQQARQVRFASQPPRLPPLAPPFRVPSPAAPVQQPRPIPPPPQYQRQPTPPPGYGYPSRPAPMARDPFMHPFQMRPLPTNLAPKMVPPIEVPTAPQFQQYQRPVSSNYPTSYPIAAPTQNVHTNPNPPITYPAFPTSAQAIPGIYPSSGPVYQMAPVCQPAYQPASQSTSSYQPTSTASAPSVGGSRAPSITTIVDTGFMRHEYTFESMPALGPGVPPPAITSVTTGLPSNYTHTPTSQTCNYQPAPLPTQSFFPPRPYVLTPPPTSLPIDAAATTTSNPTSVPALLPPPPASSSGSVVSNTAAVPAIPPDSTTNTSAAASLGAQPILDGRNTYTNAITPAAYIPSYQPFLNNYQAQPQLQQAMYDPNHMAQYPMFAGLGPVPYFSVIPPTLPPAYLPSTTSSSYSAQPLDAAAGLGAASAASLTQAQIATSPTTPPPEPMGVYQRGGSNGLHPATSLGSAFTDAAASSSIPPSPPYRPSTQTVVGDESRVLTPQVPLYTPPHQHQPLDQSRGDSETRISNASDQRMPANMVEVELEPSSRPNQTDGEVTVIHDLRPPKPEQDYVTMMEGPPPPMNSPVAGAQDGVPPAGGKLNLTATPTHSWDATEMEEKLRKLRESEAAAANLDQPVLPELDNANFFSRYPPNSSFLVSGASSTSTANTSASSAISSSSEASPTAAMLAPNAPLDGSSPVQQQQSKEAKGKEVVPDIDATAGASGACLPKIFENQGTLNLKISKAWDIKNVMKQRVGYLFVTVAVSSYSATSTKVKHEFGITARTPPVSWDELLVVPVPIRLGDRTATHDLIVEVFTSERGGRQWSLGRSVVDLTGLTQKVPKKKVLQLIAPGKLGIQMEALDFGFRENGKPPLASSSFRKNSMTSGSATTPLASAGGVSPSTAPQPPARRNSAGSSDITQKSFAMDTKSSSFRKMSLSQSPMKQGSPKASPAARPMPKKRALASTTTILPTMKKDQPSSSSGSSSEGGPASSPDDMATTGAPATTASSSFSSPASPDYSLQPMGGGGEEEDRSVPKMAAKAPAPAVATTAAMAVPRPVIPSPVAPSSLRRKPVDTSLPSYKGKKGTLGVRVVKAWDFKRTGTRTLYMLVTLSISSGSVSTELREVDMAKRHIPIVWDEYFVLLVPMRSNGSLMYDLDVEVTARDETGHETPMGKTKVELGVLGRNQVVKKVLSLLAPGKLMIELEALDFGPKRSGVTRGSFSGISAPITRKPSTNNTAPGTSSAQASSSSGAAIGGGGGPIAGPSGAIAAGRPSPIAGVRTYGGRPKKRASAPPVTPAALPSAPLPPNPSIDALDNLNDVPGGVGRSFMDVPPTIPSANHVQPVTSSVAAELPPLGESNPPSAAAVAANQTNGSEDQSVDLGAWTDHETTPINEPSGDNGGPAPLPVVDEPPQFLHVPGTDMEPISPPPPSPSEDPQQPQFEDAVQNLDSIQIPPTIPRSEIVSTDASHEPSLPAPTVPMPVTSSGSSGSSSNTNAMSSSSITNASTLTSNSSTSSAASSSVTSVTTTPADANEVLALGANFDNLPASVADRAAALANLSSLSPTPQADPFDAQALIPPGSRLFHPQPKRFQPQPPSQPMPVATTSHPQPLHRGGPGGPAPTGSWRYNVNRNYGVGMLPQQQQQQQRPTTSSTAASAALSQVTSGGLSWWRPAGAASSNPNPN